MEIAMKLNTKIVTGVGVLFAVAALVADPKAVPVLATLLGANAAAKLAAIGTLISALGKSLVEPKDA